MKDLTKKEILNYIEKYNLWRFKDLMNFFNEPHHIVRYYLNKHNISIIKVKQDNIRNDILKGMSHKDLLEKYNISRSGLLRYKKEVGVKIRKKVTDYSIEEVKNICINSNFIIRTIRYKFKINDDTFYTLLKRFKLCEWFKKERYKLYPEYKKIKGCQDGQTESNITDD